MFKVWMSLLLVMVMLFCIDKQIGAFEDQPPCFVALQTTFFDDTLVLQALNLHNINQGIWPRIVQLLHERSRIIPDIVRNRANQSLPSPLDYPFRPNAAMAILLQVLFEVFHQVMWDTAITTPNEGDIRGMFAYIKNQQDMRIRACLNAPRGF